jgi:mannosyltransferase OCH1-like enzyme
MAIPKIIYQTYKTNKLPLLAKWHISRFRSNNPDYQYEFYDDERVNTFIVNEYGSEVFSSYKKIRIGAAKADFFRYAVLFKKGGVYLDIDSTIQGKLSSFIQPNDSAIISAERNPGMFVQWALVYEANHSFLQRTLEIVLENIATNRYPNDVHQMTGPTAYSTAIRQCLEKDPSVPHRVLGIDYNGHLKFKYALSGFLSKKSEHWKKTQVHTPVLHT